MFEKIKTFPAEFFFPNDAAREAVLNLFFQQNLIVIVVVLSMFCEFAGWPLLLHWGED